MDKALIEKAREYAGCKMWRNGNPEIVRGKPNEYAYDCQFCSNCCEYKTYIAGANWQREQLIKELREWIESNKELRGYTGIPDDTLNIILAKLDLLKGEK